MFRRPVTGLPPGATSAAEAGFLYGLVRLADALFGDPDAPGINPQYSPSARRPMPGPSRMGPPPPLKNPPSPDDEDDDHVRDTDHGNGAVTGNPAREPTPPEEVASAGGGGGAREAEESGPPAAGTDDDDEPADPTPPEPAAQGGQGSQFHPDRLDDHFERHGDDFGAQSAQEYERMADDFLTGPLRPGVQEKHRSNGDVVRFDAQTDEFGVVSGDGVIRTYYKPDPAVHGRTDNQEYFDDQ